MSTAADIIKGGLRDIGAIAAGETPSAAEISDGLESLNEMMNSWSAEGLALHVETREELTLVASQQSYTIGSGADFDTTRPEFVKGAGIKESGNDTEFMISVLQNMEEWQRISDKSTTSNIPTKLWYNPTYPNGTVNLWPIPDAANTLVLYSEKPLTTFALSTTDFSFPPGWFRALRKNLAVEMAPEYGVSVSGSLQKQADDSYANIVRSATKPVLMRNDAFGLTGHKSFNWKTGE